MAKIQLGTRPVLYPMPALLVGADVDLKPNYMAVAWGGIACGEPLMISVALRVVRHTLKGIRQNGSFSVNIPSKDQIRELDYCGIVSGATADKVKDCGFRVFYGTLKTAPMIEQCPLNLECQVEHQLELGSHVLVIGRIVETYLSEECLTDGHPDVRKIRPLIFTHGPGSQYYEFGDAVGAAFQSGRVLVKKE